MVGRLHGIGIAGIETEARVHIGLPAALPYLPHQHVGEGQGIGSLEGEDMGPARLHGIQLHPPGPVIAGRRRLHLAAEFHRDPLARIGLPPDGHGHLPLQDHMVGELPAHAHPRGDCGGAGQQEA